MYACVFYYSDIPLLELAEPKRQFRYAQGIMEHPLNPRQQPVMMRSQYDAIKLNCSFNNIFLFLTKIPTELKWHLHWVLLGIIDKTSVSFQNVIDFIIRQHAK